MGVLVARDGSVYVVDSGVGGDRKLELTNPETGQREPGSIGQTARVLRVAPDGTQTVLATLPSIGPVGGPTGGSRLVMVGGTLYVSAGGWRPGSATDIGPRPIGVASLLRGCLGSSYPFTKRRSISRTEAA